MAMDRMSIDNMEVLIKTAQLQYAASLIAMGRVDAGRASESALQDAIDADDTPLASAIRQAQDHLVYLKRR